MTAPLTPQPRRTAAGDHAGPSRRSPARLVATVFGVVFTVVGIAGFVPGLTTNSDQLGVAGHDSMALLLGVFMVSILHNAVHLLFGVAGLLMARTAGSSRAYLIGGGAVYLVLWLYGLVIDQDSAANFVPVNTADNWLHLGLAIAMIALGVLTGRTVAGRGTGADAHR